MFVLITIQMDTRTRYLTIWNLNNPTICSIGKNKEEQFSYSTGSLFHYSYVNKCAST